MAWTNRNGVEVTGTQLTKLGESTEEYLNKVFASGRKVAIQQAAEMEKWAKDNAPWRDRTGDARAGLEARVVPTGPIGTITLSHNPDLHYAIWLELAHQGRYAILAPAADYWGPRIRQSMQRLVNLRIVTVADEGEE